MGKWTAADIPDLSGKSAIVTGANAGLGFYTGLELARHGAEVTLACRNRERGERARAELRRRVPAGDLALRILDVANLDSVRAFADEYLSDHPGLDILVNNAGVMATPYTLTPDGFELQFATNYLGHFALTGLLLPALLARPGARVVNLTTFGVNYWGKIDFNNLQGERKYNKSAAYTQAKMANLVFAKELSRRYAERGLIGVAAHPGYAVTDVLYVGPRMTNNKIQEFWYRLTTAIVAKPTAQGAWPSLYAACAPGVEPGESYAPQGPGQIRGRTGKVKTPARAEDPVLGLRLWDVSEDLTGVSYELTVPKTKGP
ncbi:oxidoreductase [Actinomadura alba]|uniref:SDR family NAD(P)-dependent oxidoreductase n=1 Tax=Actinomadura alba TaxID=406431 RepID=A0ABR7LUB5_9ACTN|nr:oxidoreductase [Actinomadura alba]MBC6468369.1 SDR family NAD(P)-dependent oxidoreductase [Actinomadura alba]